MSDLIYLASPYSHTDAAVREERFVAVCRVAAKLISAGKMVISPIAHSHPVAVTGGMPVSWEHWRELDMLLLSRCDVLYVLLLDGWYKSVGVRAEIDHAAKLGLPLRFVTIDGEIVNATGARLGQ